MKLKYNGKKNVSITAGFLYLLLGFIIHKFVKNELQELLLALYVNLIYFSLSAGVHVVVLVVVSVLVLLLCL